MQPGSERGLRSPILVAAALGAAWGFAGYVLLWGYTPIVIQRPFVLSAIGTVLLLPVRIVLWAVHGLERAASHPFDFAENNWWIGVAAAIVGAAMVALVTWVVRAVILARRRSGGERLAEPSERV
jgi:hypothetical protein